MKRVLDSGAAVQRPRSAVTSALQQVLRKMVPASDAELLSRYVDAADAEAFAELVARYGPMVMGVARRKFLRQPDQEDVCQATFWLLSRDARKIRERDKLAGWLYQVACRMAKKCKPHPFGESPDCLADARSSNDPAVAAGWRDVAEALDAELLRLPTEVRTPLVICLLEGATQEQAALRLGCSYATLRRRFDRGRELLRLRLEKRGLSPLSLAAFVLPPSLALGSVSPILGQTCAGYASAAVMPASAIPLVTPTVIGMKQTLCMAACTIGLGLAVLSANQMTAGQSPPEAVKPKTVVRAAEKKDETQKGTSPMRFRVVDENRKPVEGAELHFGLWAGEKDEIPNCKTDSEGVAVVTRPNTIAILRVWCYAKGYATLYRGWETGTKDSNNPLPAEFTFPMRKATTIGGRIVDPKGRPIAGAKILAECDDVPTKGLPELVRYNNWLSEGEDAARTDKDGYWKLENVPAPAVDIHLRVLHPDFISDLARFDNNHQKQQSITMEKLRTGKTIIAMAEGARLSGVVTDAEGKHLPKAVVVFHDDRYLHPGTEVHTDDKGRYLLPTLPPETRTITVAAVGHAPMTRELKLAVGPREENFKLEPGNPLKVKVMDEAGKPVKSYFMIMGWRGKQSIYTHRHSNVIDMRIPNRTNAEGIYDWSWAPADAVKFQVGAEGYQSQELELTASAAEHSITLKSVHSLAGRVTDAKTGESIPKFHVYQVLEFSEDHLCALRHQHDVEGKAGKFHLPLDRTDTDYRVLIEAEGYRSVLSKASLVKNGIRGQDFALERAAPVTGRVLDSDGKPVAGAAVCLANTFQVFDSNDKMRNHETMTDVSGGYKFPAQPENFVLVVRAPGGFAKREFSAKETVLGELRLQPWAKIRGKLWQDGKPVPEQDITIFPMEPAGDARLQMALSTKTGLDGSYEIERVPPSPASIHAYLGPWNDSVLTSSEIVPMDPKPGETLNVDLSKTGAKLMGKISLAGEVPKGLDLHYSLNYLIERKPGIALPKKWNIKPVDFSKEISTAFMDSDALRAHRKYFVKPTPDGNFHINGVPAGDYVLALRIFEKPEGCLVDPVAEKIISISVSAEQAAKGEVPIPEIEVSVRPPLKIGKPLPDLALKDAGGKELNLADFKGRHVLLHGWAGWCTVCSRDYPALKKLAAELPKDQTAVIRLNLDADAATTRELATKHAFNWPHAVLAPGDAGKWSIGSLPIYMVLAPDGRLALRTHSLEEAGKYLKERK